MPFWNFWRKHEDDAPSWGQSPRLTIGETVRLQTRDMTDHVYLAKVASFGLRRILLTLEDPSLVVRQPLTLYFERGDALYHFETRLIGPARRGAVTVAFPRKVVRVQRRQYYRLLLEKPATFRVQTLGIPSAPQAARLVNLSGGGALLAVGRPLPAGLVVSLRIPTGNDGSLMPVDAETLGCQVTMQGSSRVYFARLRFTSLTDDNRDAIIAYIHEQQRIFLRSRKLLRT